MSIQILTQQSAVLLIPEINQSVAQLVKSEWFNIDYWNEQDAITGQSRGRYITWFIGHEGDEWVLRHYYRGGMIARLFKDQYLFSSIENTRCYQELLLLEEMYLQGLPVPKPVAAKITKKGLFYRADILIEKIPDSKNLVQYLTINPLEESDWHEIGALVAKFHQTGIYHSDLNAHNILIDVNQKFWLIDFDKCDNREPEKTWQNANLARLKRSFNKEKTLHRPFHFESQHWHWLLQGYQHFYSGD